MFQWVCTSQRLSRAKWWMEQGNFNIHSLWRIKAYNQWNSSHFWLVSLWLDWGWRCYPQWLEHDPERTMSLPSVFSAGNPCRCANQSSGSQQSEEARAVSAVGNLLLPGGSFLVTFSGGCFEPTGELRGMARFVFCGFGSLVGWRKAGSLPWLTDWRQQGLAQDGVCLGQMLWWLPPMLLAFMSWKCLVYSRYTWGAGFIFQSRDVVV